MTTEAEDAEIPTTETPYSNLVGYLIEKTYRDMGCDLWDTRRVQLLCAKLGETPQILARRMRLRWGELNRRMKSNVYTKQDELLLTLIEREIDFVRGGRTPTGSLIAGIK